MSNSHKTPADLKVDFTLEQIEEEAVPSVKPLRMGVRGKVIELQSPMQMEAAALTKVLEAMSQSAMLGELGEAAAMVQLLPSMIGEDNYQVLLDAKVSMAALMKISDKVQSYYEEALAAAGADPKDSSSQ